MIRTLRIRRSRLVTIIHIFQSDTETSISRKVDITTLIGTVIHKIRNRDHIASTINSHKLWMLHQFNYLISRQQAKRHKTIFCSR